MRDKESISLPVPQNKLIFMPIKEFCLGTFSENPYERETKCELWGYSDVEELAAYLGGLFLDDREGIAKLLTDKAGVTLYYIEECAECMHLKYYYYSQKDKENYGSKNVMVIGRY